MPWWQDKPDRWQREAEQMQEWFPTSRWGEHALDGGPEKYWELITEPTPPPSELPLVLADLDADRDIEIGEGGRIRHHSHCHAEHVLRRELEGISLPSEAYLIEVTYREPPAQPYARCIIPKWTAVTLPGHPHFYLNGSKDVICPAFPSDDDWAWWKNTAADYTSYVSIWILKTSVWAATAEQCGKGIWIGSSADHSIDAIMRVHPDQPCVCGSGRRFRQCHLPLFLRAKATKGLGGSLWI